MSNPLVSIVIPNFNRASLIGQTLDSIIGQQYTNWEALVIDDGSTDNSAEIINTYCQLEPRIKFISRTRLPKGAPTCRNTGIEQSKGDYLIFLDSDDLLAPYCLATRVNLFMENPMNDFLVFQMSAFNNSIGDSAVVWNRFSEKEDLPRFLKADITWSVTGPIWKRAALLKIGPWDEAAKSWQDWEFHVRALAAGLRYKKMDALPDCFVRRDFNNRISKGNVSLEQLKPRYQLFNKIYSILKESNNLTETNKCNLGILYFGHAEKSAVNVPKENLATQFSGKIHEFGLLSTPVAILVSVYIYLLIGVKRLKLPFFSGFLFKVFHFLLPRYLVNNPSNLCKHPLPEDEFQQMKQHNMVAAP